MSTHIETTITFGKHNGTLLSEMPHGYLKWMLGIERKDPGSFVGRYVTANREAIDAVLDPRARVAKIKVDYTLSPSQGAAVKQIEADLLMGDAQVYRLEGGAGYGKSYTVLDVVRLAMHHGYEVHACAVSYVATQVLCAHLEEYGIEPRTIASQIKLSKVELEDQESYEVTPDTHDALSAILDRGHLLIVDEYSMVGDEHADMMMEAAHRCGGKLLCVGDLKQLPPVKQNRDSSFSQIPGSVTLTDPMRYSADSDLYQLEQLARHYPSSICGRDWNGSTQVVAHKSMGSLLDQYMSDYKADPQADARMLFFRRADVMDANTIIRDRLFGEEAATSPVIEDEALMVTSTTDIRTGKWIERSAHGPLEEEKIRYYSGETFRVLSTREDTVKNIPCHVVTFEGRESYEVPILFGMGQVMGQESRGAEEYQARLSQLRDAALDENDPGTWGDWREFKNTFLSVSHRYATTVHRSQGATLDRVYFDPKRLQGTSMADKLTYVAATRAKQQVHMVADAG